MICPQNQISITTLSPHTTYTFYVRPVCPNGLTSWSTITFRTECSAAQLTTVAIQGNTTVCSDEQAIFSANAIGHTQSNLIYEWSTGATIAEITANTADSYAVTATDANGCTATRSVTVTAHPLSSSEFTIETSEGSYTWNDQTYTENGDYVQVFENQFGCDSMVTLHLLLSVGVEDYDMENFSLYPNPVHDYVNLKMSNLAQDAEIQLYSVSGKLLQTIKVTDPAEVIRVDMHPYAPGVYFLGVGNVTKKFVKN